MPVLELGKLVQIKFMLTFQYRPKSFNLEIPNLNVFWEKKSKLIVKL